MMAFFTIGAFVGGVGVLLWKGDVVRAWSFEGLRRTEGGERVVELDGNVDGTMKRDGTV